MAGLMRRPIVVAGVIGLGGLGAWLFVRRAASAESELAVTVKSGDFHVTVTTSGELRAPKFVAITAPPGLQSAQLFGGVKITALAPEGTIVQKGDFVADLDRAPLAEKLTEAMLAVQKAQAVYEQAALDSTLTLSKERDNLQLLESTLEEKTLAMQQVAFEAPAIKRQAEIDLQRAKRGLEQAKLDYETKRKQSEAKMREVGTELARTQNKSAAIQAIMGQFTILAPAAGMVMYVRQWDGGRRGVGGQVSDWDPVVARLPDLTVMESITYVNEIDVRKVVVGQTATVRLDADPSKVLRGKVTSVANAGEQRPNADAKVFEVRITMEGADTTLRPGMTTSSAIDVDRVRNALAVPLEALGNEKGVPFVYKRTGGKVIKQEVATGAINEDAVVVVRGAAAGDRVLLSAPKDAERLKLVRLPAATAAATPRVAEGGSAKGTTAP